MTDPSRVPHPPYSPRGAKIVPTTQTLQLPALGNASIIGVGNPRPLVGRARTPREDEAPDTAPKTGWTVPTSPMGASPRTILRPSTPPQSVNTMQHNFADVSKLLREVVEGNIAAADFGRTVRTRANDDSWLAALGMALREVGSLVEKTSHSALEKQRALAQQSAHLAFQRQEELERVAAENAELKATFLKLDKENAKLRDQLEFLATFPSAAEAEAEQRNTPKAGGALFAVMRRAREQQKAQAAKAEAAAQRAASRATTKQLPGQRAKSIEMRSEHVRGHEKQHADKVSMLQEAHEKQVELLKGRMAEERKQHAYAVESREELAAERRSKEERRLALSAEETELSRIREGAARAQAAAAAEVLAETQDQVAALLAELERTKLQLQTAREQLGTLEAERQAAQARAQMMAELERQRADAAAKAMEEQARRAGTGQAAALAPAGPPGSAKPLPLVPPSTPAAAEPALKSRPPTGAEEVRKALDLT